MPLTIQDSRILIKTSTTTTEVPETAPSNDHTDGTWNTLDVYKGELFINTVDNKIWMRSDVGIVQIGTFISNQANTENYAVATGTDTYAASLTPPLTVYSAGSVFAIKIPNANTGASTININGLGAKDLKLNNGALSAGAFTGNTIYLIAYDGTDFDVIGGGSSGGTISGLTTNELVYGASATTVASLPVATYPNLTELSYLKGTTSSVQTQFTAKKTIATGNAYKFETTDASGNLQETTVTASRAVVTDANGLPTASATTATELGYVSGVTSSIQTQLNSMQVSLVSTAQDGTASSGTANTLSISSLINANSVSVDDILLINGRCRFTGTTAARTIRLYLNTSSAIAGATLIGTVSVASATILDATFNRSLAIKSATVSESTGSTGATDSVLSGSAVLSSNIDWTVNQYLILAIQMTSGSDSGVGSFLKLTT